MKPQIYFKLILLLPLFLSVPVASCVTRVQLSLQVVDNENPGHRLPTCPVGKVRS